MPLLSQNVRTWEKMSSMPPSRTVIAHLVLKELPMRCAAVCMADAPVILHQRI